MSLVISRRQIVENGRESVVKMKDRKIATKSNAQR